VRHFDSFLRNSRCLFFFITTKCANVYQAAIVVCLISRLVKTVETSLLFYLYFSPQPPPCRRQRPHAAPHRDPGPRPLRQHPARHLRLGPQVLAAPPPLPRLPQLPEPRPAVPLARQDVPGGHRRHLRRRHRHEAAARRREGADSDPGPHPGDDSALQVQPGVLGEVLPPRQRRGGQGRRPHPREHRQVHVVLAHVEPSAAPLVRQPDRVDGRHDVEQEFRQDEGDSGRFGLFGGAAPLRRLSGARVALHGVEEGLEHQGHLHGGVSALEAGQVQISTVTPVYNGCNCQFMLKPQNFN
jgi:hypothetical protein